MATNKPRLTWEPSTLARPGYVNATLRDATGKGRAVVVGIPALRIFRAVHVPYVHADTLEDEPRPAMKFTTQAEAEAWCEAMVVTEMAMFNN